MGFIVDNYEGPSSAVLLEPVFERVPCGLVRRINIGLIYEASACFLILLIECTNCCKVNKGTVNLCDVILVILGQRSHFSFAKKLVILSADSQISEALFNDNLAVAYPEDDRLNL